MMYSGSSSDLLQFVIEEKQSLRAALAQIDQNQHGIVLAVDAAGSVVGVATDGDIRRALLAGRTLDDSVRVCMNREFRWALSGTSHENLLKQLDQAIRLIPLLDPERRLIGVVTRDYLPVRGEERTYARARAPVRVSFGGGGSDLTHYFVEEQGAVINSTVSMYSHATLRRRDDGRILLSSLDLGESMDSADLAECVAVRSRFGLIQAILKVVQPQFGFELYLNSDFPLGSGLGGSAAVSAAVLGCLNMMRQDRWDSHELAEIAFQAERLHLGIAGGWQDQYATVFGGFNFMEFSRSQNVVHPLRVHQDVLLELEESLILCDTGISHDSGDIHLDQRQVMAAEDIRQRVQTNVRLTYEMRNLLLRGRLAEFGLTLNEAWKLKRQFSSKISSPEIDATYDQALNWGASGGKLLGAGGGGFFVFYCPPFRKHSVMSGLQQKGLVVHPFKFEQQGLQSWSVREGRSVCPAGAN